MINPAARTPLHSRHSGSRDPEEIQRRLDQLQAEDERLDRWAIRFGAACGFVALAIIAVAWLRWACR